MGWKKKDESVARRGKRRQEEREVGGMLQGCR